MALTSLRVWVNRDVGNDGLQRDVRIVDAGIGTAFFQASTGLLERWMEMLINGPFGGAYDRSEGMVKVGGERKGRSLSAVVR